MEKLTLEIDPNTADANDDERMVRFHLYESSVKHGVTGAPLLSLASRKAGMRLTRAQAEELHAWLGDWLVTSQ